MPRYLITCIHASDVPSTVCDMLRNALGHAQKRIRTRMNPNYFFEWHDTIIIRVLAYYYIHYATEHSQASKYDV